MLHTSQTSQVVSGGRASFRKYFYIGSDYFVGCVIFIFFCLLWNLRKFEQLVCDSERNIHIYFDSDIVIHSESQYQQKILCVHRCVHIVVSTGNPMFLLLWTHCCVKNIASCIKQRSIVFSIKRISLCTYSCVENFLYCIKRITIDLSVTRRSCWTHCCVPLVVQKFYLQGIFFFSLLRQIILCIITGYLCFFCWPLPLDIKYPFTVPAIILYLPNDRFISGNQNLLISIAVMNTNF